MDQSIIRKVVGQSAAIGAEQVEAPIFWRSVMSRIRDLQHVADRRTFT